MRQHIERNYLAWVETYKYTNHMKAFNLEFDRLEFGKICKYIPNPNGNKKI